MKRHAKLQLAETVAECAADPYAYAMFAFPWGQTGTPLEGVTGPRKWQRDALRTISDHLQNPVTRLQPLRMAVASGHAAGKSSLIAMLVAYALDTCPDTRVIVTANTEGQLLNRTMPEILKWRQMSPTRDWFKPAALSLASAERGHAHSWRLDAVPWSATSPEAFAGLHNQGRRAWIIFDEAAGIDDRIWETAEGILADEGTEIAWLAMGNPLRGTGRFRECFGRYRTQWDCRHIDCRYVEGINQDQIKTMIEAYGIDSDLVKVRVLGQFPSASSIQFIGSDVVQAARARVLPTTDYLPSDPLVFGLDHARWGKDETVLAIRQGRDGRSREWLTFNGSMTSMDIAGAVHDAANRYFPDAIFIDAGGPNAGGIIDRLRQLMGDNADRVFEINFGSSHKGMEATGASGIRTRVANRRAQMWVRMKDWLERGAIPDHQRLADDLTGLEYGYNVDNAILLEKKENLKSRGLASPDYADALALTFAEEVTPRQLPEYLNPSNYKRDTPYDRYADVNDDRYDDLYERYGTALPSAFRRSSYDRYGD